MKSKSVFLKAFSWLLSAFLGYAHGALFVVLIFSPSGCNVLLAQNAQPVQTSQAPAAPTASPAAVRALAQSNIGSTATLSNLRVPMGLPTPAKLGPMATSKAPVLPERKVRERGLYKSKINLQKLDLSRTPSEEELRMAGQLGSELSPLFDAEPAKIADPVKRKKQEADNLLMGQAMQKWNAHQYDQAVTLLNQHRVEHADSPWACEAELHLGCASQFSGNWEQAKNSFESILAAAPAGSDIYQKAKLRRSILYVQQGQLDEAKAAFAEMIATETSWERRTYAHRWLLEVSHYQSNEVALRNCGSESIALVLREKGMNVEADRVALLPGRTSHGYSLGELTELAQESGLQAVAVRADGTGQLEQLPVPFVAHYRDRHFVVVKGITDEKRVRLYDPRLKHEVEMDSANFEAQCSGLAVIFQDRQPEGIVLASQMDLMDEVGGCCGLPSYPGDLGPDDCPGGCTTCGMPGWSVNPVNLNVCVDDVPLWYDCGFGPKIEMEITYNSQDALNQMRPFGNKWVFKYTSYAMESPNSNVPQGSVLIVMPGGRGDIYRPKSGGGYTNPLGNFNTLTKLTAQGNYEFSLGLPDGTVYRYGVPDAMLPNGTSSLLKSITDRHGNQVTIVYDTNGAIQKVKDPLNRECVFTYNPQGFVQWIDDPFGRRATFSYDAAGNLVRQTDMGGLSYGYTYDGNVYLTSLIKPSGTYKFYIEPADGINNGSNSYPAYGGTMWDDYRVTVTHPDGYAEEFYYDGYHRSGWHRDKLQFQSPLPISQAPKTAYAYSLPGGSGTNGVISQITYADGKYKTFGSFNSNSQAQYVRDENGGYTYYTFNPQGKVLTRQDPRGNTTTFTYMSNGIDLWKVTDAKNIKQQERMYFPGTRNISSITDATNHSTQLTYNTRGQVETITDGAGNSLAITYQYLTTTKSYPTERVTTTKQGTLVLGTEDFDELARTRAVTDADGMVLIYELDGLNRITKIVHSDGTSEQNDWGCCWLDKQIDRLGNTTTYWRNYFGQPLVVQNGADRLLQYEHDANGNMLTLYDESGNPTRWEYDSRNHMTKRTFADNSFYTYVFDGLGNLKQRTDAKGITVTYGYNLNNLLETISAPGLVTITYTYDPKVDWLVSMSDVTGTTTFGHDDVGRINSEDGPLTADVITTTYDGMGRVQTRTINNDINTKSTTLYDNLERLQTQANPLGNFSYGYRSSVSPRLASLTYPNGQVTSYEYDSSKDFMVKEIWNKSSNGQSTLSKFNYAYNSNDQIITWIQQFGATIQQYDLEYDAANRLSNATLSGSSIATKRQLWGYDDAGNRVSEQTDSAVGGSSFNALNQLSGQQGGGQITLRGQIDKPGTVTVNGQPANTKGDGTFTSKVQVAPGNNTVTVAAADLNGNSVTHNYQISTTAAVANRTLIYDQDGNLTDDGTHTYEWDPLDRLTAINYTGTNQRTEFSYDGFWRRAQVLEKTGGTVTKSTKLLWASGEAQPLEERDGSTNAVLCRYYDQGKQIGGTSYYFTRDHLGSVRDLVDGTGNLVARYDYDLWGKQTQTFGNIDAGVGFAGLSFHAASGLSLTPYRAYSADLGRWMSRDPLPRAEVSADGPNLYAYVGSDPLNKVDPSGLCSNCLTNCMLANGAGWAMAALGISAFTAGTLPKPFGAGNLGGGPFTTGLSLLENLLGRLGIGAIGLRAAGRFLNPIGDCISAAAAGFLAGLLLGCAGVCASDSSAY